MKVYGTLAPQTSIVIANTISWQYVTTLNFDDTNDGNYYDKDSYKIHTTTITIMTADE